MNSDAARFATAAGHSALRLWADLPRNVQEQLFEGAVGTDDALRLELALYLHDHHPRTAHPQKPDMSKLTDENRQK
jgi:hypothetical protein